MLKIGSVISNQSQSSTLGLPTNGSLVLKYFLSETIHNGSRGTHFAKFLISNFLKGLTYSALVIEPVHHGSSSILLVHFLGHPVEEHNFFCKVPLVEISKKNTIISLTPMGVHYIDRG